VVGVEVLPAWREGVAVRVVEGRVTLFACVPGEAYRRVSIRHDGEPSTVYLMRDDVRVTTNGAEVDLPGLVRFLADAVGPVRVTLSRDPTQYDAVKDAAFTNAGGTT